MKHLQVFSISLLLLSNVLFNNAFAMKKIFNNKNIFSKNRFFRPPTRWILTEKEHEEIKKISALKSQVKQAKKTENAELLHASISEIYKNMDQKTCQSALTNVERSKYFIRALAGTSLYQLYCYNIEPILDAAMKIEPLTLLPVVVGIGLPMWVGACMYAGAIETKDILLREREKLDDLITTFRVRQHQKEKYNGKFLGHSPSLLNFKIKEQKEEKKK